jgi:hypothetical protein
MVELCDRCCSTSYKGSLICLNCSDVIVNASLKEQKAKFADVIEHIYANGDMPTMIRINLLKAIEMI